MSFRENNRDHSMDHLTSMVVHRKKLVLSDFFYKQIKTNIIVAGNSNRNHYHKLLTGNINSHNLLVIYSNFNNHLIYPLAVFSPMVFDNLCSFYSNLRV
jgi:hypothetical protein